MRILFVHCRYQQRGGEDAVVDSEIALLRRAGHAVETYERHNQDVAGMGRPGLAAQTIWSRATPLGIRDLVQRFRPDVAHIHNTFPLVSPSVYSALHACGVPVVQTLHNFRWLCPQAMFLRDGRVCEDCLGRTPWPALAHGCYRGSRPQTAVLATMLVVHRAAHTLERHVARFIALNAFCKSKFVEGGLSASRIAVKPNFVERHTAALPTSRSGFVFVGRLSGEKGVDVLAKAARACPEARITVVGTGPEAHLLQGIPNVDCVGALDQAGVRAKMAAASWLLLPSVCYENFPRTIVEAYSVGLPVVASRIGGLPEIVRDRETGRLFPAGDAAALAALLRELINDDTTARAMGHAARGLYEKAYAPEVNLTRLLDIYGEAVAERLPR